MAVGRALQRTFDWYPLRFSATMDIPQGGGPRAILRAGSITLGPFIQPAQPDYSATHFRLGRAVQQWQQHDRCCCHHWVAGTDSSSGEVSDLAVGFDDEALELCEVADEGDAVGIVAKANPGRLTPVSNSDLNGGVSVGDHDLAAHDTDSDA